MQVQLSEQFIGMRLDKALSDYFGLSRNFFHNLFERKLVKVLNSKGGILNVFVKKSYIIIGNESFELPDLQRFEDLTYLEESPVIKLEIKLETSDYLVLYKPKGVLSHPKTMFDVGQASVVGFLYHKYGKLPEIGGLIKAGLIHRLDKDTDGLMIIAKTEKALSYFKKLFDDKTADALSECPKFDVPLHKYYRAICDVSNQGEKRINSQLGILNSQGYYFLDSLIIPKVPVQGYPKRGITKILNYKFGIINGKKVIELEIELLTGRTHQIRYQLSEIGLPIVGDYLYNSKFKIQNSKSNSEDSNQLQLTAFKLEFVDCDGETQSVEI